MENIYSQMARLLAVFQHLLKAFARSVRDVHLLLSCCVSMCKGNCAVVMTELQFMGIFTQLSDIQTRVE